MCQNGIKKSQGSFHLMRPSLVSKKSALFREKKSSNMKVETLNLCFKQAIYTVHLK